MVTVNSGVVRGGNGDGDRHDGVTFYRLYICYLYHVRDGIAPPPSGWNSDPIYLGGQRGGAHTTKKSGHFWEDLAQVLTHLGRADHDLACTVDHLVPRLPL